MAVGVVPPAEGFEEPVRWALDWGTEKDMYTYIVKTQREYLSLYIYTHIRIYTHIYMYTYIHLRMS